MCVSDCGAMFFSFRMHKNETNDFCFRFRRSIRHISILNYPLSQPEFVTHPVHSSPCRNDRVIIFCTAAIREHSVRISQHGTDFRFRDAQMRMSDWSLTWNWHAVHIGTYNHARIQHGHLGRLRNAHTGYTETRLNYRNVFISCWDIWEYLSTLCAHYQPSYTR